MSKSKTKFHYAFNASEIKEKEIKEDIDDSFWNCRECNAPGTLVAGKDGRYVCSRCGLVHEKRVEMDEPLLFDSPDFKHRMCHSKVVSPYSKMTTSIGSSRRYNNPRIRRIRNRHIKETSKATKVKKANWENKNFLTYFLAGIEEIRRTKGDQTCFDFSPLNGRVANRAKELLRIIAHKDDGIGTDSRITSNGRNKVFIAALVSAVEEELNFDSDEAEFVEYLESMEKTEYDPDMYSYYQDQAVPLRDKPSVMRRFKRSIMDEFDLGKKKKEKILFFCKKNGIDRFHDKIVKMITKINYRGNLEKRTVACAKLIYLYYNDILKVPKNHTVSRYAREIAVKYGFFPVDNTYSFGDAMMRVEGDSYVLLAGSILKPVKTDNLDDLSRRTRRDYAEIRKKRDKFSDVIDEKDGILKLNKNIGFKSPTGAARFVYGKTANGYVKWGISDTIKDVLKEAFIIKPKMIVMKNDDLYNAIFNDDYDKIFNDSMDFLHSIPGKYIPVIRSLVKSNSKDIDYIRWVAKNDFDAESIDADTAVSLLLEAPFTNITNITGPSITYASRDVMNDVIREMTKMNERKKMKKITPRTGKVKFWIGKKIRNGSRSLNIAKIRDGEPYNVQRFPVCEAFVLIKKIYEYLDKSGKVENQSNVIRFIREKTSIRGLKNKVYPIFYFLVDYKFLNKNGSVMTVNHPAGEAIMLIKSKLRDA